MKGRNKEIINSENYQKEKAIRMSGRRSVFDFIREDTLISKVFRLPRLEVHHVGKKLELF